ncbi:glycosyltransferase family 2 protein [bacterium]|nr:glycosyltransferase family 2 protein [candidate division CSSED10-310 bacterium]
MISVIIISYNVPDLLIRCIDSIKAARSSSDSEIIVIDNNSSDNCRETVKARYENVSWIQNNRNLGFAAAVNIGLNRARGDYFLLINPDSEIALDVLEVIRDFWLRHPDAGIVGGKIIGFDGSFQKQCRRNFPKPASAFFKLFKLSNVFPGHKLTRSYELSLDGIDQLHEIEAVSGAFMSFTRRLIEEIGMFDEGYFLMGEDLDFCYRAALAGRTNYYLPDAVMTHHHGASRDTRPFKSIYNGHIAMLRYYRKHLRHEYNVISNCMIYAGIALHCTVRCVFAFFPVLKKKGCRETS